jgi:hypothetical protein
MNHKENPTPPRRVKKSHQVQFYDDVWQKAVNDAKGLEISTQQHLENLILSAYDR